jgi:Ran-binding protein 3
VVLPSTWVAASPLEDLTGACSCTGVVTAYARRLFLLPSTTLTTIMTARTPPPMHRGNSPPMSPPSPEYSEIDLKSSRKREREVSTEPVPAPLSFKDKVSPLDTTPAPAKKNRVEHRLGGTEEEIEPDNEYTNNTRSSRSPSPPSPPQEMKIKVRQISRGVEDLTCRKDGVNSSGSIDEEECSAALEDTLEKTSSNTGPNNDEAPSASKDDGMHDATSEHGSPRLSDASSDKASLKRKHGERGTSQAPPDGVPASTGPEPPKRLRDDPDKDENPRQMKRPSPPPDQEGPTPPSSSQSSVLNTPAPTKATGFMAYASTSSPFAGVKGQNMFTPNSQPAPSFNREQTPPALSPNESNATPKTAPTGTKRSGFEAFASSSSPFATATRPKSPPTSPGKLGRRNKSPAARGNSNNVSAFSSYMGASAQAFAIPLPPSSKRVKTTDASDDNDESSSSFTSRGALLASRPFSLDPGSGSSGSGGEEDLDRPSKAAPATSSFGDRLRAQKDQQQTETHSDDENKESFEEQDLVTGEEEEETIHQVRCKLYALTGGNHWQEKGTGTLKINIRRSDGAGARLIMRKEAVYTLLLNVPLFKGMKCVPAQDPRYLRFAVIQADSTQHYNLRFANAKMAQELMDEININIPDS